MTVDYTKQQTGVQAPSQVDEGLRAHFMKVYSHMSVGLAITGLVAFFASQSAALMNLIYSTPLQWVVMFAPLAFIFIMGAKMNSMSDNAARITFYAFAAVMGLSLSYIFLVYTPASITRVFFITSATFAGMSLFGYTTKRDLSGVGRFMVMGLIGIIIASIVNLFLKSSALDFAVSIAGVLIFTGLTAWDTQKIKRIYHQVSPEGLGKAAIMGALNLYLDFINLMIFLLRFFGNRR